METNRASVADIDLEAGQTLSSANPAAVGRTHQSRHLDSLQGPTYYQTLVRTTLFKQTPQLAYGFLSFDMLHRLILINHQHKLAEHVRDIVKHEDCSEEQIVKIQGDLHQYRESMDDYIAWRHRNQSWLHTAVAAGKRAIGRSYNPSTTIALQEISSPHIEMIPELKEIFECSPHLRNPCDVWIQEKHHSVQFASPIGIPRFMAFRYIGGTWSRDSEFVQSRNRFVVAIIGGLSLIVPMLVMTLHKDISTTLATVSVSVLIFASALAIWPLSYKHLPWVKRWRLMGGEEDFTPLGAKEVLLVTAAYAAVLVVFVGTSTS